LRANEARCADRRERGKEAAAILRRLHRGVPL
jgi:hypothetical protein